MKRLLITGFEPFGGDEINPTELLLKRLPDEICGRETVKALLPVEFRTAAKRALEEYRRVSPAAVICLGQAGGRAAITPERRGVNLMEALIPDNAGSMPKGVRIAEEGPEELISTLPFTRMAEAIRAEGLPGEVSESAGRYVCNDLLYELLLNIKEAPVGFVHVPFMREQTEREGRQNEPFMELEDMERGILAALRAVCEEL